MGRGRLSLQPWEGCLDVPRVLPTGQAWEREERGGWVGGWVFAYGKSSLSEF